MEPDFAWGRLVELQASVKIQPNRSFTFGGDVPDTIDFELEVEWYSPRAPAQPRVLRLRGHDALVLAADAVHIIEADREPSA